MLNISGNHVIYTYIKHCICIYIVCQILIQCYIEIISQLKRKRKKCRCSTTKIVVFYYFKDNTEDLTTCHSHLIYVDEGQEWNLPRWKTTFKEFSPTFELPLKVIGHLFALVLTLQIAIG